MPRKKIDFDTVRKLARELGEVKESSDAIRAGGRLMAWIPPHKTLEAGTLAVQVGIEERDELIAAAPEIYFLIDHYLNYPTVLVRLERIPPDALKDLLRMALSFVTKPSSKKRRAR